MKRLIVPLGVGIGSLMATLAAAQQKPMTQVLARVEGFDGKSSVQLMAPEEVEKLEQTIRKEASLFSKALAAAEKEWKAGEETARKPFPRSAISPRKLVRLGTFTDPDKAQTKLMDLQQKEADRAHKTEAQQQARDKLLGKSKESAAREAQREAERERVLAEAVSLFEAKLAALMEGASSGGQPKSGADDAKIGR